MNDFEKANELIKEISSLCNNNYPKMWGSATALLTVKQLELNNYLDESQDELAIKLDSLIKKGEYK